MRISLLHPVCQITRPFIIRINKNTARRIYHCLNLIGKCRISKVLCTGHGINKEILRAISRFRHQPLHIRPVRGQIAAGWQEIPKIVHAVLERMPCSDRTHGKSGKSTVAAAFRQFLPRSPLCVGTILSLHSRKSVPPALLVVCYNPSGVFCVSA